MRCKDVDAEVALRRSDARRTRMLIEDEHRHDGLDFVTAPRRPLDAYHLRPPWRDQNGAI